MASLFGHAFTAISLGTGYSSKVRNWKFFLLGAICSILPDADVISFKLGISYEDFWGHRGFTHSLLFAFITGVVVTLIFFSRENSNFKRLAYISFFFLCTASHGVLDAMTSGGLGVAFFSPFDNSRYFFPWRPIKVSPIGVENFFSEWGIRVILSETIWIGVPCIAYVLLILIKRKFSARPKLH